jgi:hypothetical protein
VLWSYAEGVLGGTIVLSEFAVFSNMVKLEHLSATERYLTAHRKVYKGGLIKDCRFFSKYAAGSNMQDTKLIVLHVQDTIDKDPITTPGQVLSYFSGLARVILGWLSIAISIQLSVLGLN